MSEERGNVHKNDNPTRADAMKPVERFGYYRHSEFGFGGGGGGGSIGGGMEEVLFHGQAFYTNSLDRMHVQLVP